MLVVQAPGVVVVLHDLEIQASLTALAENARTASRLRAAAANALEAIEKLGFSYPFSSLTALPGLPAASV